MTNSQSILKLSSLILSYSKFIGRLSNVLEKEILSQFSVKNYNELSEDDKLKFNEILEDKLDDAEYEIRKITKNQNYMSWIVKNISNGYFIMWEDSDKFKELLDNFDKLKRSPVLKNIEKDINKYKNFAELHEVVEDAKEDELYFEAIKKIHPIITNGSYQLYKLTDYDSSRPLLNKTGWCVKGEKFWNYYNPPFYLITKNNKRYALVHLDSRQCKDIHDEEFLENEIDNDFIKLLEELFVKENNGNIIFDEDFSSFSYMFFNDIKSNDEKVKILSNMDSKDISDLISNGCDVTIKDSKGEYFYEKEKFDMEEDLFEELFDLRILFNLIGLYYAMFFGDVEKIYKILDSFNKDDFNNLKNNTILLDTLNTILSDLDYDNYAYDISNILIDNDINVDYPYSYIYYLLEEDDLTRFKKLAKILLDKDKFYEYNTDEILSSAPFDIFEFLIKDGGYYTISLQDITNDNVLNCLNNMKEDLLLEPSEFLNYFYYENADELEEIINSLDLDEEQYEALLPFVEKLRKKEIFEQTPDLPLEFEKEN